MYCPHCMEKIDEGHAKCPYCGKDTAVRNAENALPVGSILSERYYVGAVLGQGGFGITYVGCDKRLDKKVAIKEYYPAGFANRLSEHSTSVTITAGNAAATFEHEKQKFIKEAHLLAEFSRDRNIVNVTDILEENNTAYIVMEFVEGETLESRIKRLGKMSFKEAFELLEPMMTSLSKIHAKGMIHRDISPANIMIQPEGYVTLIDFGAAREFDAQADKSLSVILKQGYAPCEQYQTKGPQGPWTDVYAISATLYKMITGITPPSAIDRMVGDVIKRPSEVGAAITPNEEDVLMKGLSVFQGDRYSSMEDLRSAFKGEATDTVAVEDDVTVDPLLNNVSTAASEVKEEIPQSVDAVNSEAFAATELLTPGSKAKTITEPEPASAIEPSEAISSKDTQEPEQLQPQESVIETASKETVLSQESEKPAAKKSSIPIVIIVVIILALLMLMFSFRACGSGVAGGYASISVERIVFLMNLSL